MRHITARAVCYLLGTLNDEWPAFMAACDWTRDVDGDCLSAAQAMNIARNRRDTSGDQRLPDCPTCCMFAEAAIVARIAIDQAEIEAKYDAEREAEKRGAA